MSYHTIVGVRKLQVISNSSSSIIQAGDSEHVTLSDRTISVERNISRYAGNVPSFSQFEVFTTPLPSLPPLFKEEKLIEKNIDEQDILTDPCAVPHITVGCINVISSSSSSYVHLGNSRTLHQLSRDKSFDQYIRKQGCKK